MVAKPPLPLLPSPLEEEEDVMVGLALASVFAAPPPPDPPAGLSVGVLPLLPFPGCGAGGCCGAATTLENRKKIVRTSRDRVRSDLVGLYCRGELIRDEGFECFCFIDAVDVVVFVVGASIEVFAIACGVLQWCPWVFVGDIIGCLVEWKEGGMEKEDRVLFATDW